MTAINGTNVAAGIAPFTTEDTFATHYARYGQGGLHSVETIAERDAISESRLEVGMLVYVSEEDKTYQLKTFDEETHEKTWEEFVGGAGTTDYNDLTNKPAIDGVILTSSTTKSDLGLADLYKIKGSVETFEDLEDIENPQNGDAYRVIDEGKVYAWDGTEWFDIGGESSGLDTLGLIVPDTKDLQAIDEVEFDMSSSSAYYSFLKYNGTLSSLRDINGSALFRITITGENVNTTIEGVVNMRQRVAEAPYVVVRNKPGTKTASNTGARYLRLIYPKSITSGADWGFELRAYNAKARHVKVELLKADQGFELVDGTLSTYSSSVQSYTSMTLYTTDGLIGSGTLSWNTVSSDKAGYITSYLPKFVSGGTMPLCGEAVPAYSLCFMSDGKIYSSSQKLAAIDPDFGIQVCMVSTKVNAAIAYTSLRQKEAVTSLTQIPHDTLARGNPCFLRCRLENGKIFSDNYVTTSMIPGYTWYYLGVAASTKAINIDTTQSVFISLNGDGELERINGNSLDAYSKAEVDSKIELLQAASDVRDIVASYQDLLLYPTDDLRNGDVIEILEDSEHDGTATYYRWVIDEQYPTGHWVYLGERGPYYTKRQTRDLIRDAVASEALIRQTRDNEIEEKLEAYARYGIHKEYPINIPQPSVDNEGDFLFIHQPDINYLGELPAMPEDPQVKDAWIYNGYYYVKTESDLYQEAVEEDTLRFDGLYDLYISHKNALLRAYKTSSGYMPYGNQYIYIEPNAKYINFIYPGNTEPTLSQAYIYSENQGIITKIACSGMGYGYIDESDTVCYWSDAVENMTTGPIVGGDLICDRYHNPIYNYDEDDDTYYTLPIVSVDSTMEEIVDSDGNVYRRAPEYDKIYSGFSNGSDTVFFFGNVNKASFAPEDVYVEDEENELVLSDLTVENYDSITKTVSLSNGEDYIYNNEIRAFDTFECQMIHTRSQDIVEYSWKTLSNYGGSGKGDSPVDDVQLNGVSVVVDKIANIVPDALDVAYTNSAVSSITTVQAALDNLMNIHYYVEPRFTAFSCDKGGSYERQLTPISDITLSWALNKKPQLGDSLVISGGGITYDIMANEPEANWQSGSKNFDEFTTTNTNTTFTISYVDNHSTVPAGKSKSCTSTTSITFYIKKYYGATVLEDPTAEQIRSLTNATSSKALASTTFNFGNGKYWYYCIPKETDTGSALVFSIGPAGSEALQSGNYFIYEINDFTNAQGYTVPLRIYKFKKTPAGLPDMLTGTANVKVA